MKPFTEAARAKGYTQKELADRWGVTIRAIQKTAENPSVRDWDALRGVPDLTLEQLDIDQTVRILRRVAQDMEGEEE